jgi:hypothetical protein
MKMSHPITTTLTGGGLAATLLGFFGKLAWGTVRRDREVLYAIREELTLQRTNCLATLQKQGEKQIDVLESIDKGMAEQTGYLKGVLDGRHS